MIFLRRSEHQPIAVDLGHDSLKVLQLQERAGALSVVAAAQQVLSRDGVNDANRTEAMIDLLRDLVRKHRFCGRHVVAVLPREHVHVKTLRLPVLPEPELQSAIELEARNLFTTPSEQLAIRFIPAGEVKQGAESRLEVIVLAVKTSVIENLLEQFHRIGLIVDAMDFEPCATYRGIERFVRRKEDENEINVMVDVGARQSQVIIGRGREITFTKSIDIGGATLTDCVARKLSLPDDEAASLRRRFATLSPTERDPVRQAVADATRNAMADLAHEIALCLRYYSVTFRGQRPARLRLLGGEANDAALRQALGSAMTVPVEVFRPFQGVDLRGALLEDEEHSLSEWGVAFGAALRRVKNAIVRKPDAGVPYGRRKSDASLVEVVDLSTAIKTAGVMEAPDPRRRSEEHAHA